MGKRTKLLATVVAGVLLSTTALVGCKDQDNSGKDSKELLIYVNSVKSEYDAFNKIAQDWAKGKGYKVKVQFNESTKFQDLMPVMKSKNGPDIILGVPHDNLGNFVKANLVAEVPEGTIDTSAITTDEIINAVSVEGKQYGIPTGSETVALFYNKDKVSEVPATMEDLVKKAKDDKLGFQYDLTNFFYSAGFILSGDGYIFQKDADGKYDTSDIGFDSEDDIEGFKFIKSLKDDGLMDEATNYDSAKKAFLSGDSAFYISGPWDVSAFEEGNVNFGVAPMPTLNGKTVSPFLGVQMGFVNKNSSNQDLAFEFFKDNYDELCNKSCEVGNRLPVLNSIELEKDALKQFTLATESAKMTPNIPEISNVWDPVKNNVTLMLQGQQSAEDAGKNAEKDLANAIK